MMSELSSIEKRQALIFVSSLLVLIEFWKIFIAQVSLVSGEIAWLLCFFVMVVIFSIPIIKMRYHKLLLTLLVLLIVAAIGLHLWMMAANEILIFFEYVWLFVGGGTVLRHFRPSK